jgi:hypothetical protein
MVCTRSVTGQRVSHSMGSIITLGRRHSRRTQENSKTEVPGLGVSLGHDRRFDHAVELLISASLIDASGASKLDRTRLQRRSKIAPRRNWIRNNRIGALVGALIVLIPAAIFSLSFSAASVPPSPPGINWGPTHL